jgi:formylglycine-generating enzyme required for sulfatase activity/serine/threonine protein kinase
MPSDPNIPSIETLKRIDELCDQFELDSRNENTPSLGNYLDKVPMEERSLLFKALLGIQLELHNEDSFDGIQEELINQYSDEKETISQLIDAAKARKSEREEETKYQKSDLTDQDVGKQKHPKKIDRFEIKKILGKGGFGTVYKAIDTESNQTVAIKIPLDSTLNSEENLNRFIREGEIAAGLDHPGICPVYEVSSDQDVPFIVMKYVEGPSMADIHKQMNSKNRLMNIPKSVSLIQNIGEAIEYAHHKGVIHRDLKPANIIWDKEESTPLITDFGLARYWKNNESDLTVTGQGMGTPAYIAPEQARGHNKDLGKQVDVYSLGVIFYELLCGQRPFPGKDFDVVIQKSAEDPPPPSKFRSEIDSQLDAICLTVIARSTEDRFQSVQEFLDALEKYQAGDDFSFPKQQNISFGETIDFESEEDLPRLNPISLNQKRKIADKSKKTLEEFRESFNLDFDPYYRWLGITSKQRPVTHYQLLGVGIKEQDREAIFNAAERQKMNVKAFQGDTEGYVVARILYEIEEARFILFDDDYRTQYDTFMTEKRKKRSWERRYQKWRKRALQNSELPKEYVYITQSSGFVEEFLMTFSIILAGFVLMAWVSFTYWPKPGDHKNKQQNIAVNVPVKKKPVVPKPLRKRKALGNPKKKKLPPKKPRVEVKGIDPDKPFDIAKFKLTNDWVNLLPSIDIEKYKLEGGWKKEDGVLSARVDNNVIPSALYFPVKTGLNYQLDIEFDLTEIMSDFMVYLPIANKRCRLGIFGNWVEISKILNEEKRSYNIIPVEKGSFQKKHTGVFPVIKNNREVGRYINGVEKNPNKYGIGKYLDNGSSIVLNNNKKYQFLIGVNTDGKMAVITAKINGKSVMDWTGPVKDIVEEDEYDFWKQTKKTGIALVFNSKKASQVHYHHILMRKTEPERISRTPNSVVKSPHFNKEPKPITKTASQIKVLQKNAARLNKVKVHKKNSIGIQMTLIPSGTFIMGTPKKQMTINRAELAHPVKISKPFYIGKYEVTRGQFRRFIEETGYITQAEIKEGWGYNKETNKSEFSKSYNWKNVGFHQSDRHPVVDVSWNDVVKFCEWLSKKETKTYRLPTEAEWEYSCRAGTSTPFSFKGKFLEYSNLADLEFTKVKMNGANWGGNKSDGYAFTAPVGHYKPNAFGLHDIHGNVYEWCIDTMVPYIYFLNTDRTSIDPQNTTPGNTKVKRGGCWNHGANEPRSAWRNSGYVNGSSGTIGFRIVREL